MLPAVIAAFAGFRTATAEQLRELLDGLRQQLAPATVLEALLVEQIVLAVSRLSNAAKLEEQGKIDNDWLRYQTMAERAFWKAYNTLEKNRRQAARAARAEAKSTSEPVPQTQPAPTPITPSPASTRTEPATPPRRAPVPVDREFARDRFEELLSRYNAPATAHEVADDSRPTAAGLAPAVLAAG